jgi:hypothetical protein
MLTRLPFALLGAVLGCGLFTMPAQAQRARVFVASYGNDSNPCSFGSPCRTFQAAHDAVAANGEITAIDSAGFGPLNIRKAVTLTSPPGIEASIAVSPGGDAIAVAAGANDVVTLRGLTLNGGGSGSHGVNFTAGQKLTVIDCFITNYAQQGILFQSSSATNTLVLISNTVVSETVGGIELITFGTGTIIATFSGLTLDNNADSIQLVGDGGGAVWLSMTNSQIGYNSQIGFYSRGSTSNNIGNIAQLRNVSFGYNGLSAIYLDGSSQLDMSHITQFPVQNGITCNGNFNAPYSDGSNDLNLNEGCGALGTTILR